MQEKRVRCFSRAVLATAGTALALMAVNLSAGPAAAQQDAAQACTPDVFRLCNEHIPDRARITACLHAKRSGLSAACRPFFAGAKPVRVARAKGKKPRKRR